MSNAEKINKKILYQVPVPNDITPNELSSWLKRNNWIQKPGKGSHLRIEKTFRDGFTWSYTVKFGGEKQIKPVYISDIRNMVEEHDL